MTNKNTGADPGFFSGGGALVSCSTSTPINHIVFFWQNTSCIRKPQVISGKGARTPCTLLLDPPLEHRTDLLFTRKLWTKNMYMNWSVHHQGASKINCSLQSRFSFFFFFSNEGATQRYIDRGRYRETTNRELNQRQRWRNENGKKEIGLDWQNNKFARALRFFVHFFAVTARLPRENRAIYTRKNKTRLT